MAGPSAQSLGAALEAHVPWPRANPSPARDCGVRCGAARLAFHVQPPGDKEAEMKSSSLAWAAALGWLSLLACGGHSGPSAPSAPTPAPTPTPAPPGFDLTCQPSQLVVETDPTTTTCAVSSVSGFSGEIALRCSGQPSGVPCELDPPSLSLPAETTLTTNLIVGVSLTAPAGQFSFQVVATAGNLTQTTSLGLTVGPTCSGFKEQPSYAGNCRNRPPGTICWGFPDGYVWLANDGYGSRGYEYACGGQTVSVARGGRADYHHVLWTEYVKEGPRTY